MMGVVFTSYNNCSIWVPYVWVFCSWHYMFQDIDCRCWQQKCWHGRIAEMDVPWRHVGNILAEYAAKFGVSCEICVLSFICFMVHKQKRSSCFMHEVYGKEINSESNMRHGPNPYAIRIGVMHWHVQFEHVMDANQKYKHYMLKSIIII